jgi:23S rRNA (cytidine1920-2'-O)/16S rRNA (cytidine1409-2'-O)-methyltransferase
MVWQGAEAIGWHYGGVVRSPITGPAGNVEFLLWLRGEEIAGRSAPDLAEFLAVVQADNE